jgi:5'-nucleotidase
MRILLTNDDGYDAPGLRALYDAVKPMGEVFVVAPVVEQSGCSHKLTLGQPILVEPREHEVYGRSFAVGSTPADCVRLAVSHLYEEPFDLVVSGINRGANAGIDTFYSGTVAAAREGAIQRISSIAVSQGVRRDVDIDWAKASEVSAAIIPELVAEELPGPGFWTLNLPAPIPADYRNHIQRTNVTTEPVPLVFERREADDGRTFVFDQGSAYWHRPVADECDYSIIRDGGIAICAIPLQTRF